MTIKKNFLLILNLKTYKEATGLRALKILKICEKFKNKARIMVAVQATDIHLSNKTSVPIFAQHVDYNEQGRNTGKILPEAVKQTGAIGTFINHSENPLKLGEIKKTIERCKKNNLLTLVCVPSIDMAKKVMKFKPWAIAYEIPELVATGKAISKINPGKVKQFSSLFKKSKIMSMCGAGVSSGEDVKKALELGCKGVLVSSAFVKAKNQEKVLEGLLK